MMNAGRASTAEHPEQGSDIRVCTQKTRRVFFGRAHLKNPVKNPPILILYLTFFSYQLDRLHACKLP